jgi:hypothetical protein
MHRTPRFSAHLLLSLCVAALVGCGGDGKPKSSKIAAAFENQVDPRGDAAKAGEDMRKLKEKVAADAEAAVLAEIEKVTTPVADAPTDPKLACEAVRGAYDGFVQRRLAGNKDELAKWSVMKGMDLDKAVETCLADNQPKVAACQQNAFAKASAEIGRDRAEQLLTTCNKKFGRPLASAPAAKDKPAG